MDHDFWRTELGLDSERERAGANSREGSVGAIGTSFNTSRAGAARVETQTDFDRRVACDQFLENILPIESDFFIEGCQLDESTQRLLLSLSSPTTHEQIRLDHELVTPEKSKRERCEISEPEEDPKPVEISTTNVTQERATCDDSTVSLKDILALALPRVDPYSRQRLLELHSLLRRGSLDVRGFIRELRNVIGARMLRALATELEANQPITLEDDSMFAPSQSESPLLQAPTQNRSESIGEASALDLSAAASATAEVSSSESAPLSASQGASFSRPKKRAWTRLEHYVFLKAMQIYGRGKWKYIADVLPGRTPNQVASHAKKFFLRQRKSIKDKRMRSIHDLILSSPEMREVEQALESGAIETPGFDLAALGIVRKVRSAFPTAMQSYQQARHGSFGTTGPGDANSLGYAGQSFHIPGDQAQIYRSLNDSVSRGCDMRLRRLEYTAQLLRQTISTMRAQTCGGLVDPRGS
jgi:SHAQKYF class myb-like DNA-binding protein